MKKVILGIALLSQFSYGVEGVPEFTEISKKANQSLVPLNFFDISKVNFRKQLKKSAQRVADDFFKLNTLSELDEEERENQKLDIVNKEFGELDKFCKKEFNKNRDQANEAFLHVLAARTKDIMQNEIAQKEAEIVRLQGRLDELLKESPQTAVSLNSFDKFIRRAEEDVRASKEKTENFDVSKSELIGEKQINRTFARFSKKLENIQNEVQKGKDDLEKILKEVFEKTQEQYEDSTNTLIENLGDRYEDIMANVEERYEDQTKHLAEAYDRQIAIMNDKINEFTVLNARLEKEKELLSLINGVYRSNPDNAFIRSHSFISGNAQEIRGINDLFNRRNRVEDIYNKVRLFSDLFGREDLGVDAKASDLEAVRNWLEKTRTEVILGRYGPFYFPKANADKQNTHFPPEQNIGFDGVAMSSPLREAKGRISRLINTFNSSSKGNVIAHLNTMFSWYPQINTRLHMRWWHSWWNNGETNRIEWNKNDQFVGSTWQEHGGGWWGDSRGALGSYRGKDFGHHDSCAVDKWNNICIPNRDQELANTVNGITSLARLLFDFETNPNSPLQRLYQESGQTNPSVIAFPSAEIDTLVRQCNEFIKKTV